MSDAPDPVLLPAPEPPPPPRTFYSPGQHGFYRLDIHGEGMIPADAVEISDEVHGALIAGLAAGGSIVLDSDGRPGLAPRPTLAEAELRSALVARCKAEAGRRIVRFAPLYTQSNDNALAALAAAGEPAAPEDLADARARRARIEGLRADCRDIQAAIAGLSGEALTLFDPADDAHWPSDATEPAPGSPTQPSPGDLI